MDFPDIKSLWQKPVNDGESMDSRRVTRVVTPRVRAQDPKSQTAWVLFVDGRGNSSKAELRDWRRWAQKATKVMDGVPVIEPEVVHQEEI